MAAELMRVAASSEWLINGVAVSQRGRVFASCPRWLTLATPSIAEITATGALRPFPGDHWNDWQPGAPADDAIVSAHSVHIDRDDHLWIVDDAGPRASAPIAGAAKLIEIDLASDSVVRVYRFDRELLPAGTMLGHVRVDTQCGYITEAHHGAIVVVDRATGVTRKLLAGDRSIQADPSIVPIIEGREFRRKDGAVPQLHVDLLELDRAQQWLYFMPLFGPMLRRIETRVLRDATLSAAQVASAVEDVAPVPPCAGIARDAAGDFYFCSFTEDAIVKRDQSGAWTTIARDARISFPNEGMVGPDGWLYFPASQAHRLPAFSDRSRVQLPFEILKVRLT